MFTAVAVHFKAPDADTLGTLLAATLRALIAPIAPEHLTRS